ncbi:MAG: nucleoside triphosphate pyrophosphohydrolase [Patescibacteria group bacterium]
MSENLSPEFESNKRIYNKLVRDQIPEIIARDNATCETRTMEQEEFITALAEKLTEESKEFTEAEEKSAQIKELADISEVIKTIMAELDIDPDEVEVVRQQRRDERGGFEKRIFLISTEGGNYKS